MLHCEKLQKTLINRIKNSIEKKNTKSMVEINKVLTGLIKVLLQINMNLSVSTFLHVFKLHPQVKIMYIGCNKKIKLVKYHFGSKNGKICVKCFLKSFL